jgi:hypothetical protein
LLITEGIWCRVSFARSVVGESRRFDTMYCKNSQTIPISRHQAVLHTVSISPTPLPESTMSVSPVTTWSLVDSRLRLSTAVVLLLYPMNRSVRARITIFATDVPYRTHQPIIIRLDPGAHCEVPVSVLIRLREIPSPSPVRSTGSTSTCMWSIRYRLGCTPAVTVSRARTPFTIKD